MRVIFVIGFLLIGSYQSLRSSHYCNLALRECEKNRLQKLECTQYEKCPNSHTWQCGENKCAINEKQCNDYLRTEKILRSNMFSNIHFSLIIPIQNSLSNVINQEFKQFQNSFKNCTRPEPESRRVKLNDLICISGRNCLGIGKISKKNLLKRINCPCYNMWHQCENHYCAHDLDACEAFKLENITKIKAFGLKHCNKDYILIE